MKKKFIAMICSLAMLFTMAPMVANTNVAKAATPPSVEMGGATLRTSGTQALRFVLNMSNYDPETVTNFGIKLTVGSKTKTIDFATAKNVYSYDAVTGAVQYTAAITDIPVAAKATDVKAVGFVETSGETTPTETAEMSRNLEQVANAAGLTIGDDGKAADMGGTLASKSWNAGTIGSINGFSGKLVNISFSIRMQGALADGTGIMAFQSNLEDSAAKKTYPYIKENVAITNAWQKISIKNCQLAEFANEPSLYVSDYNNGVDKATMNFYVKDYVIEEVASSDNIAGEAVKTFSYSNGSDVELTSVNDEALGKDVYQIKEGGSFTKAGAIVKFIMPAGKTLSDYDSISFKIKSNETYKAYGVDWRVDDTKRTNYGNSTYGAYKLMPDSGYELPSKADTWQTKTVSLVYDQSTTDVTTLQTSQNVYMGIMLDLATANDSFYLSDITLNLKK